MIGSGLEQEVIINQAADKLCRLGLRTTALVALEAVRPLSFLGGQLLWIAQPALTIVFPRDNVRQMATLLEDPAAIEALINQLEARES